MFEYGTFHLVVFQAGHIRVHKDKDAVSSRQWPSKQTTSECTVLNSVDPQSGCALVFQEEGMQWSSKKAMPDSEYCTYQAMSECGTLHLVVFQAGHIRVHKDKDAVSSMQWPSK